MSRMFVRRTFGLLVVMMASGGVRRHALGSIGSNRGIASCHAFGSSAFAKNTRRPTAIVSQRWTHNQYTSHSTQQRQQQFTVSASGQFWSLRGGAASTPSAFSSSKLSASTQSSPSTLLSSKAQESLLIAGRSNASSLKSFGGLTYRDSFSEPEAFRVVFVLGGPGAGKGTQCDLLKANYPCVHLSAGELLRQEAAKKDTSEHAALIEERLVNGQIVPVEISLALLRNAMKEADGKSLVFLIDGFPRNFDNLEGWTRVMVSSNDNNGDDSDSAAVWGVLAYECPLPILEERVMERSKDSGRSDDNLDSLRRRFKTFQAETVPVLDTLRLIGDDTLLKVVDIAGDRSLEKVWEETQKTMNNFIANNVLSANVRLLEAAAADDVDTYRSLCADEMFEDVYPTDDKDENDNESTSSPMSPKQIMAIQERTSDDKIVETGIIKCAEMTFVTGKKVSLTYDRLPKSGLSFKETRIWSHQGPKGWRLVHFFRTPSTT